MNGAADKMHGYDDGEAAPEYRRHTPAAPYIPSDEIETLLEIERLTKLNNK